MWTALLQLKYLKYRSRSTSSSPLQFPFTPTEESKPKTPMLPPPITEFSYILQEHQNKIIALIKDGILNNNIELLNEINEAEYIIEVSKKSYKYDFLYEININGNKAYEVYIPNYEPLIINTYKVNEELKKHVIKQITDQKNKETISEKTLVLEEPYSSYEIKVEKTIERSHISYEIRLNDNGGEHYFDFEIPKSLKSIAKEFELKNSKEYMEFSKAKLNSVKDFVQNDFIEGLLNEKMNKEKKGVEGEEKENIIQLFDSFFVKKSFLPESTKKIFVTINDNYYIYDQCPNTRKSFQNSI